MANNPKQVRRRDFLELSIAGAAGLCWPGVGVTQQRDFPHEGSLSYLDQNQYIHNMEVVSIFMPGQPRAGKMQMMATGDRRLLFQGAWNPGTPSMIIDVSDPLKPIILSDREWFPGDQSDPPPARQFQLAYNAAQRRWILMNGYSGETGLKGVRFLDATDPKKITLLSEWSCDQGDPGREQQHGSGTHRNYYDGGRYAYLDTMPDDNYPHSEIDRINGLQVIDVADPLNPKFVSNWMIPGAHGSEADTYRMWKEWGDSTSFTSMHGGFYVPRKVEDGGRYSYSTWGAFGLLIHDVSDPANPKLVGHWDTNYNGGAGIPFHATDVTKLDRGFVIVTPEPLQPDCVETWHEGFIIDVRDPGRPRRIATLPIPKPPPEAPFTDFCNRRGRFGAHNPPHQKAPGRPNMNFYALCYFAGGLQCYDVTFPGDPVIAAYFVPPMGGDLNDVRSYFRNTDNVFVEWDRKLIWAATSTGLYALSTPMLGDPVLRKMPVREWSLPNLNRGHA